MKRLLMMGLRALGARGGCDLGLGWQAAVL